MQFERCLGCLEEAASYPCPHCGFDPRQAPAPSYALPLGTVLNGHYVVGKMLGQGGFGITYIGFDLNLERKVAIKEYYPKGQASRYATMGLNLQWSEDVQSQQLRKSGIDTFLREAQKMVKVEDIPQVVRVLECFHENGTAYIVMDYIQGKTLLSVLKEKGPMTWEQAKDVFLPAISAMEQVHQAGMVHRDLSPDNLMITDKGVRILDLGAAKDLNVNTGASSAQVAKVGFSPFEQYTQRGGSGPWSDVYAMAATIYYTLTGVIPPAAMDRMEEDATNWSALTAKDVPAHVVKALQKAMAISVKERTQSMQELLDQLRSGPASVPDLPKLPKVAFKAPAAGASQAGKTFGKKQGLIALGAAAAVIAVILTITQWYIPYSRHRKAEELLSAGQYDEAIAAFRELDDDAMVKQATYSKALSLSSSGKYRAAMSVFQSLGSYSDSRSQLLLMQRIVSGQLTLCEGGYHTVGIRTNGTVMAVGDAGDGQCEIDGWKNITSIAAGFEHTVGLKADGTVVAAGSNDSGQCDVSSWKNIVAISARGKNTVGLKKNGTVVATGDNESGQCDVDGWTDIVAVSAGRDHTVGLKEDGTVVAVGDNEYGQCDVDGWTDIVAISARSLHTVGLKADGTVVAVGSNANGQCDVDDWTDIVAIAAGFKHTLGLKKDGTVVAVGQNTKSQCDVEDWKNIVAIAAGDSYSVGLKKDGTIVAIGRNDYGQCDVEDMKGILVPQA